MNIDQLPAFLKPFFRPFQNTLTLPQFPHLWGLLLALVLNVRASKLVHLARLLPLSTHRTRHGAFLAVSHFDAPLLLSDAVARLLNRFKPRPGEKGKGRKIADLVVGLIKHQGRFVRMKRARGTAKLKIASLDGHLSRIGRVRMVVSKRPHETWKSTIAIVTNSLGTDARAIVAL